MVEFLKAKQTQYFNKPVGVVSSKMGGEELAVSFAEEAKQITNLALRKLEQAEIKKGKDYVKKIQTRDAEGNLVFEPLPNELSDVARETAEPLLDRIYSNELTVDTVNKFNSIRASKLDISPEEFTTLASQYLAETERQLKKENVGILTSDFRRIGAKYIAQHQSDLMLEQAKRLDKKNTQMELQVIDIKLKDLESMIANGDDYFDSLEEEGSSPFAVMGFPNARSFEEVRDTLLTRAANLLERGKINFPRYKDIQTNINRTYTMANVRKMLDPIGNNLDLNAVNILRKFVMDEVLTETEEKHLEKYNIDYENFATLTRTDRDFVNGRLTNYASVISNQLSLIGKTNNSIAFENKYQKNDIFTLTTKDSKYLDESLIRKFPNIVGNITADQLTNEHIYAIASTVDGMNYMTKHNGLSYKTGQIFKNIDSMITRVQREPKVINEFMKQLDLFRNFYSVTGKSGQISNDSFVNTIGENNFKKWLSLDARLRIYGEQNIEALLSDIQGMRLDESAKNTTIAINLAEIDSELSGNPTNKINQLLNKFIIDEKLFGNIGPSVMGGKGFNPEAKTFLRIIAEKELAVAGTNADTLKEILKNTYNALYVESSVMYTPIQNTGDRGFYKFGFGNQYLKSRFAPERYFGTDEHLEGFKNHVNNKINTIMQDGTNYELGKNIFLYATTRSGTMDGAEYVVVSGDNSKDIFDPKTSDIIMVTTKGYMAKLKRENLDKYNKALAEQKLLRLRRIRKTKTTKNNLLLTEDGKEKSNWQLWLESFIGTQDIFGRSFKGE